MGIPVVKLDAVQVLALSCIGLVVGVRLKAAVPLLERLNIPVPIIGGLVFAVINLLLHGRVVDLVMDLSLQDMLMTAFFTTIGLSASFRLIRAGGRQVVWFLLITAAGALCQNLMGISVTKLLGLDPLLGIIGGSVALTGGPGTALAFGGMFEQRYGVQNATGLGVACAMFGIACGGLLGGPIGARLITKNNLHGQAPADVPDPGTALDPQTVRTTSPLLRNTVTLAIAMGIGTLISHGLSATGVALPGYLGGMIAAALLRNLDDRTRWLRIDVRGVDELGDVALSIFIVMAMLSLRLWELFQLAVPIMVLLVAQLALVWLMCKAVFRLMGRDYEAAVMSAGFCGFMLGTAANAMASMTVLRAKFGDAPRAFLIVPLVGVSLIDFFNALMINVLAGWLR